MRVLILGANGMMGPWVSKLLNKNHEIIETFSIVQDRKSKIETAARQIISMIFIT